MQGEAVHSARGMTEMPATTTNLPQLILLPIQIVHQTQSCQEAVSWTNGNEGSRILFLKQISTLFPPVLVYSSLQGQSIHTA